MRRFLLSMGLLIPAIACAQDTAPADAGAQASQQAQRTLQLFQDACFRTFAAPDAVASWAAAIGAGELPPDQAAAFLGGDSGRAWSASDATGGFVVASVGTSRCTVYARRAKAALVRELYLAFLPTPSTGLQARQVTDSTRDTENGVLHTLAHEIGTGQRPVIATTVLSTSASEQAPMQAILSLSMER